VIVMTAAPEEFKIACYLGWCGAETTFPFATRHEYDQARAFLDKLVLLHMSGNEVPSGYSKSVRDLYVLDERHRDAFDAFMRDSGA
jgi:hypothetical protein